MPSESQAEDQLQEEASDKLTAGDVLREERLRRGLSEKAVADKLHITMHYVKALESNTYEKLPGAVFIKGYIKSYALLLELDVEEVYALYNQFNAQLQEGVAEASRQRARRKTDRNKPWVILSIIVFVGGFAGLWLYNNLGDADLGAEMEPAESNAAPVQRQTTETVASALSQQPAAVEIVEPVIVESLVDEPTQASPLVSNSLPEALATPSAPQVRDSTAEITPTNSVADTTVEAGTGDDSDLTSPVVSDPVDSSNAEPEILDQSEDLLEDLLVVASVDEGPRTIEVVAPGSDVLRITFSGESWIEVNDNSSELIYRDLREDGDVLEITGSAPFGVLLGDAPFANITLNDTAIDISNRIRIDNSARLTVGL